MEERLPFAYISFPEWFERRYPDAVNNVRLNAHKLTSPYDLYETLKDLLQPLKQLSSQQLQKRLKKEIPSSKVPIQNELNLQTNYTNLRYFDNKKANTSDKNKKTEKYFTDTGGVCMNKTNLSLEMKLHCNFKRKIRGISLFLPIPNDRTCEDAGIPAHYCTCQVH
jgi:hypothetical protein